MFIVLLKFSGNKANAAQWMEGHKAWLQSGFDDGVFMLAGSLTPSLGGAVLAHRTTMEALRARVDADPFVVENVVSAEIMEIAPARAEERLGFLLG